jgi:tetratricopeptide (TPR) repeat protein
MRNGRPVSKAIFLVLLLFISRFAAAQDSSLAVIAEQAAALYGQGDYTGALGLYEMLAAAGIRDGAVHYNMGQAYFAVQDTGRALLEYRRAQQIAPRDAEINLALAHIRASRADIQGDDAAVVDSLAALTIPLLTLEELGWLTFVLWTAYFILAGFYVVRAEWRSVIRMVLFVSSVLLLFAFALCFSRMCAGVFRPAAVVTAVATPIMSGPGEDYLEIYELHAAAEIRILEDRGDWAHFVQPDGREGWIQSDQYEKV